MALSSAAKNLEDDYSECWDLLKPQPQTPKPAPEPAPKKNNVYKVTDAQLTIGEHLAHSYTYPIAIEPEPGQRYLVDGRIVINGYEYQIRFFRGICGRDFAIRSA